MTSAAILPLASRPSMAVPRVNQPVLFEGCIASERLNQRVKRAIESLDGKRLSALQRECNRLAQRVAHLEGLQCENLELKRRLQRLLKLKLKMEEKVETVAKTMAVTHRTATARIRETETYATHVLKLYEAACALIQKHIVDTYGKERWLNHKCPGCGPQPIYRFAVRPLPSGSIGFAPYCLDCEGQRKKGAKAVMKQTIQETAAELVDRSPKVAKELVERFEEEVENNMEE